MLIKKEIILLITNTIKVVIQQVLFNNKYKYNLEFADFKHKNN